MPFITYEAGKMEKEKKNELIKSLTETASRISGIPETSFTVLIKENPIENWGVGGVSLEEIMKNR